jgi:hypoxanthine phosphoribosyltransferase
VTSAASSRQPANRDGLTVLISRQEIADAVQRLAAEIRRDYEGREPLLIGVLKGAFMFTADLMRVLNIPVDVDFVRVSTYGSGTTSSGRPRILQGVRSPIKGRHILIVEDIVDTGLTTRHLEGYLQRKGAASIKLCALLSKPSRRRVEATIDYLGFEIPDRFVVGYGLDYDQRYRYLPDVCVLDEGGA